MLRQQPASKNHKWVAFSNTTLGGFIVAFEGSFIVELENGQIAEIENDNQLLAHSSVYSRPYKMIYESQNKAGSIPLAQ